jgi:hypothetical protein
MSYEGLRDIRLVLDRIRITLDRVAGREPWYVLKYGARYVGKMIIGEPMFYLEPEVALAYRFRSEAEARDAAEQVSAKLATQIYFDLIEVNN